MLETQYRMHPMIAEYSSFRYYQGRLVTDQKLIDSNSHKMPYHDESSGRLRPFVFHDIKYGRETSEGSRLSFVIISWFTLFDSVSNMDEAKYVLGLYEYLVTRYPEHKSGIGIIAPYRSQRKLLSTLFRERFALRDRELEVVCVPIFLSIYLSI